MAAKGFKKIQPGANLSLRELEGAACLKRTWTRERPGGPDRREPVQSETDQRTALGGPERRRVHSRRETDWRGPVRSVDLTWRETAPERT